MAFVKPQQKIEALQHQIELLKRQLSDKDKWVENAKMTALGQFTAGISHELNQFLSRILLNAEMAQHQLHQDSIEPKQRIDDKLSHIIEDVHLTSALLKKLQIYCHQGVTPNLQSVALQQPIDKAIQVFTPQLEKHRIQWQLQFAHQNKAVLADAKQIELVIGNLISNAIDAMKSSDNKQLIIRTFSTESLMGIAIEDSGNGIAKSTLPYVFDPFFTTKPSDKGIGLGLSLSKGIIEDHNGEIKVESSENAGCTITVILPEA